MNDNIFRIKPIYMEKIWGGDNLTEIYSHTTKDYNLGEVWLFSAIKSGDNLVELNNELCTLSSFFKKYSDKLGVVDQSLPKIQLRLVDSKDNLSLQVHPDEKVACLYEEEAKEETWLFLKCKKDSKLIMGCNENEVMRFKNGGNVDSLYNSSVEYHTQNDDIFHIKSGMLHALGKDNFVLEISQPSNTTYRVFDYYRKDKKGEFRELHLEKSREAIMPYAQNMPISSDTFYIEGTKVKKTNIDGLYSFEQISVNGQYNLDTEDSYKVIYIHESDNMKINNESVKTGDTFITFKKTKIKLEGIGKVVVAYE